MNRIPFLPKRLIHIIVMKEIRSFLTIILSMKMIYCENMEMDFLILFNVLMILLNSFSSAIQIVQISQLFRLKLIAVRMILNVRRAKKQISISSKTNFSYRTFIISNYISQNKLMMEQQFNIWMDSISQSLIQALL